jgi:hypothetical protein
LVGTRGFGGEIVAMHCNGISRYPSGFGVVSARCPKLIPRQKTGEPTGGDSLGSSLNQSVYFRRLGGRSTQRIKRVFGPEFLRAMENLFPAFRPF